MKQIFKTLHRIKEELGGNCEVVAIALNDYLVVQVHWYADGFDFERAFTKRQMNDAKFDNVEFFVKRAGYVKENNKKTYIPKNSMF